MSWIERASNTAIRSIFSNLYTGTLKNVSSNQLCINTYNTLLYLRNNDSMQAFIRYLKKNNKVTTN
jgi:hypothetical protein